MIQEEAEMNEKTEEISDNPTGNAQPFEEKPEVEIEVPLFMSDKPDTAQGNLQDEQDEAPE